ncbi:MAG: DUF2782 domain-containing protein [Wenzhouxiangella sp.]
MNHRHIVLIATLALIVAPPVFSQQREVLPPPPIREPLPPPVQDRSEQIEPEVRIRREDDRTVEEFSIGGQVFMIRITPAVGPAYYLIDTTGDGNFESRHEHMEPVRPAFWRIFEW